MFDKKSSEELPITHHLKEIEQKYQENQILIVSGLPGCGKSTQIPKIIYSLTQQPLIITQPRRLAAVEMAKRVSFEMKNEVKVSYTVRFEDTSGSDTIIRFVTDGVLLRLLMDETLFRTYKTIVIDEVHERTIFIDLILYLLKRNLAKYPQTKLILMSATMNSTIFQKYFLNFKMDSVLIESAKAFTLDIEYIEKSSEGTTSIADAVECVVNLHMNEPMGDILVFLPGAEECLGGVQATQEKLMAFVKEGKPVPSLQLHALFGTQAVREQELVFDSVSNPLTTRKVIFATNIAETSLTIENIAYVIDSGLVKKTHFNKDSAAVQLKVCLISKSQAIQRAGRAGRTRNGKAIRLYSKKIFNEQMTEDSDADIKRSELRSFIVFVLGLGMNNFSSSDFIEEPDPVAIQLALQQLYVAGLIEVNKVNHSPEKHLNLEQTTKIHQSSETDVDFRKFITDKIMHEFRPEVKDSKVCEGKTSEQSKMIIFSLTKSGKAVLQFPIDPLLAKTLLLSRLLHIHQLVGEMTALFSTTESLMNNTFDAKKQFYKAKIKEGDKNGDFYTLSKLMSKHESIFHQKALHNVSLIKRQLLGILTQFSENKLLEMFNGEAVMKVDQWRDSKSTELDKMELCLQASFPTHLGKKIQTKNEYRLYSSSIICLIDSESIYEILNHFPEFVIGTGIRGEGYLGVPTLINIFRIKNPQVAILYCEKIKEFEQILKHGMKNEVFIKEKPKNPEEEKTSKTELAKLKYLERKKIKIT